MPLINCKIELKLKWMNQCVLSVNGNENANSINSYYQRKKLYVPVLTLSAKDNQEMSKRLIQDFKDLCITTNIKQKVRKK